MLTKTIVLLILSIFLLASFSFPQKKVKESNKQLVGKWATVVPKGERSQTIITFHSDGKVEYDIAAIIEGTYFLHKDILITQQNKLN